MVPLNVLVGGECSGIIRDAFRALGDNAWSCDLKPAEVPAPSGASLGHIYHLRGDVRRVLQGVIPDDMVEFSTWRGGGKPIFIKWDLAIFHPDCTYLCNSGVKWCYKGGQKKNGWDWARDAKRLKALDFWQELEEGAADIPHVAFENPIPHPYTEEMGNYSQIIQPWQFGHRETKATCLWLRNLPDLVPTAIVGPPRTPAERKEFAKVHRMAPGPDRATDRARTLPGIAFAMTQWRRAVRAGYSDTQ